MMPPMALDPQAKAFLDALAQMEEAAKAGAAA